MQSDRAASATSGTTVGVALIIAGALAAGAAYGAAMTGAVHKPAAPWLLVFGASASSAGLFVLGAATRGALTRRVAVLIALLFVVLVTSFGTALALPPTEGSGRLLLGLPLRLAIVFYGVGFLPLFVLPVAFGLTFDAKPGSREGVSHAVRAGDTSGPVPGVDRTAE